jgi:hypothetical protein
LEVEVEEWYYEAEAGPWIEVPILVKLVVITMGAVVLVW